MKRVLKFRVIHILKFEYNMMNTMKIGVLYNDDEDNNENAGNNHKSGRLITKQC